jgi:hypothetical protein
MFHFLVAHTGNGGTHAERTSIMDSALHHRLNDRELAPGECNVIIG